MAIYHFSCEVIGRSIVGGASSQAAAAYRAAAEVGDHDFTGKSDVVWSGMLFADGCPEEIRNREALWSAVDRVEKRKDAQLFRSFNFAFPNCFEYQDCVEVLTRFAGEQWVALGMCADLSIHDKVVEHQRNLHGHAMVTLREVTQDGFGKKRREWNEHALMKQWREAWERAVNERLRLIGSNERIDSRSYKDQACGLEPTSHLGRYRTVLERSGVYTDLGDHNRAVQARNELQRTKLDYKIKDGSRVASVNARNRKQAEYQVFYAPMSISLQKQIDLACGTDYAKREMIRRHNAWIARSGETDRTR